MRILLSLQWKSLCLRSFNWLLLLNITLLIGAGPASRFAMGVADTETWDYAELAAVLRQVNSDGMVNYRDLKENRHNLDQFSKRVAKLKPDTFASWGRNERIAFWINAYNGLTLLAIIDNYPIKASFLGSLMYPKNSIRQISGVWDSLRFTVLDDEVTLEYIEHSILRKEFDEPRIHMALVCAARSCPTLRQEPYSGPRLDGQLDDQTRTFLRNSMKFRIDYAERVVFLSKIFDWFGEDFVDRYGTDQAFRGQDPALRAVLNFISCFLSQSDRSYLKNTDFEVSYLEYDWSLNEQGS